MRGVADAGTTEDDPTCQVGSLNGYPIDHFGDMALNVSLAGAREGPENKGDGDVIAVLHSAPHGQLGDLGL